ncbi:MAG: B12-binding domain-containing radical SAM protein [Phycisphaerales bacterium]|nr:B12-binding domain-containing radical SAM protein [Phycisphaerales bacterium]
MNILLVSPKTPSTFWSFCHVMPFISRKAAFPPLGLATVAAMLPREWQLKLVDLNVENLRDADIARADYVFITGMLVHEESARAVIARSHALGKKIAAGGPLFTTGHERFPEVDHFVLGEGEDLIPELVRDLVAGTPKRMYRSAARPDVSKTPIPRWDLLNLRHYATMSLQYSRGCPFDCEFCDIIVMYGRQPRVKSPEQFIAELESLIAAGWKGGVFVVDDNFIGNRARAKDLLRALIAWRVRTKLKTPFLTEASLNLVDDEELLDLMVRAGFKRIFVGIESPQTSSLVECAKVQNSRRDMMAAVRKIHNAGIEVMGGFIVGFDSDQPDIFEQQRRFVQRAGVVTAMVGLLTALPETRLFKRLLGEGRIVGQSTGDNVDATLNFVPRLDRQMLVDGYRNLVKRLYAPAEYYRRLRRFLRDYKPAGPRFRPRWNELVAFVRSLWIMGVLTRGRRQFWAFITHAAIRHPRAFGEAMSLAIMGYHFRRIAEGL